jgi:hypothetical protein
MTGTEVADEQNAATLPTSMKCHVHNRRKHMGRYHIKDAKTFLYTVWRYQFEIMTHPASSEKSSQTTRTLPGNKIPY